MKPILNIALRAARKAGSFLVYERMRLDAAPAKEDLHTLQLKADIILRETISKTFPNHILTTDVPDFSKFGNEVVWHIQTINGEENFFRNIPHYATVIVVYEQQKATYVLIYDPNCEEFFVATLGAGAKCDDSRIRVAQRTELANSLVMATKNDTHIAARAYFQGCNALALAYVAAGRADMFYGSELSSLELAAGNLLLQEAGALVGDLNGGHDYFTKQELLAANPKLFKNYLKGRN